MDFRAIIVTALIIGLGFFALVAFSGQFSMENNTNTSIYNSPGISSISGDIGTQLNQSTTKSQAQQQALMEESGRTPVLTTLGFYLNSILTAGNAFMTMGVGMFTSVFNLANVYLGISPIFTGTLLSILLIVIVLAAWSLYRAGR